MLTGTLEVITQVAMLVFVVGSMAAMGLGLTVTRITEPLRDIWLVVALLIVNFAVVPAAAIAAARLLPMEDAAATAIVLIGCVGGAPSLPKLAQLAKSKLREPRAWPMETERPCPTSWKRSTTSVPGIEGLYLARKDGHEGATGLRVVEPLTHVASTSERASSPCRTSRRSRISDRISRVIPTAAPRDATAALRLHNACPMALSLAAARSDYRTIYARPGWAEQDPEDWHDAVVRSVAQVTAASRIALPAVLVDDRHEVVQPELGSRHRLE